MDFDAEIEKCLEQKKAIIKKRSRLIVFDSISTSAGVISVCALPISLVALIPLGASIGLGVYVNIKDKETANEMREVNFKCNELESGKKYYKRINGM